jgi:hypothetical protein
MDASRAETERDCRASAPENDSLEQSEERLPKCDNVASSDGQASLSIDDSKTMSLDPTQMFDLKEIDKPLRRSSSSTSSPTDTSYQKSSNDGDDDGEDDDSDRLGKAKRESDSSKGKSVDRSKLRKGKWTVSLIIAQYGK